MRIELRSVRVCQIVSVIKCFVTNYFWNRSEITCSGILRCYIILEYRNVSVCGGVSELKQRVKSIDKTRASLGKFQMILNGSELETKTYFAAVTNN